MKSSSFNIGFQIEKEGWICPRTVMYFNIPTWMFRLESDFGKYWFILCMFLKESKFIIYANWPAGLTVPKFLQIVRKCFKKSCSWTKFYYILFLCRSWVWSTLQKVITINTKMISHQNKKVLRDCKRLTVRAIACLGGGGLPLSCLRRGTVCPRCNPLSGQGLSLSSQWVPPVLTYLLERTRDRTWDKNSDKICIPSSQDKTRGKVWDKAGDRVRGTPPFNRDTNQPMDLQGMYLCRLHLAHAQLRFEGRDIRVVWVPLICHCITNHSHTLSNKSKL